MRTTGETRWGAVLGFLGLTRDALGILELNGVKLGRSYVFVGSDKGLRVLLALHGIISCLHEFAETNRA